MELCGQKQINALTMRKILFWTILVVVVELLFLHFVFGPPKGKLNDGYRLLTAQDLANDGPDLFQKTFPDLEKYTLESNNSETRNFTEVIHPVLTGPDIFVLFFVTSTPEGFERRQLIRTTWANTWRSSKQDGKAGRSLYKRRGLSKVIIYCVFMVGVSSVKYNRRITQEAAILGDIYRAPIEESYRNMVYKVWSAYTWALDVKTEYIFKVDDDVYVHIPRMIHWLKTDVKVPKNLYAGYVVYKQKIERQEDNDWFVNQTEFDQGIYPNYCIGPFYIFSWNILQGLVDTSKKVTKFQVEDAYMGVLMRHNYVLPYNVGNSLFIYDGSHGRLALEYTEEKLKHAVCIGERLTSAYITKLHERYDYIRKRIDGKM